MGNQKVAKKKAMGVDFKRVKRKVGRKLAPPDNSTKTSFKSKAIVLPTQTIGDEKEGVAVTQRKQTLKELCTQCSHYSPKVRKDALIGLRELLSQHPQELAQHTATVIETVAPRMTDIDKSTRDALLHLFRRVLLPGLPETHLAPFAPILLVHICSAMTHLSPDIRTTAISFLDLIVEKRPSLIGSGFSREILGHYANLLFQGGGSSSRPAAFLLPILRSLLRFLSAAHLPEGGEMAASKIPQVQEQTWGGATGAMPVLHSEKESSEGQALHSYRSGMPPGSASLAKNAAESVMASTDAREIEPTSKLEAPHKRGAALTAPAVAIANLPADRGPEHYDKLVAIFSPLLLQCCGECAATLFAGAAVDSTSLDCLLSALKILHLLFSYVLLKDETVLQGSSRGSSVKSATGATWGGFSWYGDQKWGFQGDGSRRVRAALRENVLAELLRKLRGLFPLSAPALKLPAGVKEGLAAVNVQLCQLLAAFLAPFEERSSQGEGVGGETVEEAWETALMDFYEGALHGMVLPSAGLFESDGEHRLAEPHWKTLVPMLPHLLECSLPERRLALIDAFAFVYKRARPSSGTKSMCLSMMEVLLLRRKAWREEGRERAEAGASELPDEVVQQWLQSLPRMIWDLKDSHPTTSEAILRLLLHIGRSAPPGSFLAEQFSALQPSLVPLFCVWRSPSRPVFGPFLALPDSSQTLALNILSYLPVLSPALLRALACCCLYPSTPGKMTLRAVEIMHRKYCIGGLAIEELLSFLWTLLLGRMAGESKEMGRKRERQEEGQSLKKSLKRKMESVDNREGGVNGVLKSVDDKQEVEALEKREMSGERKDSVDELDARVAEGEAREEGEGEGLTRRKVQVAAVCAVFGHLGDTGLVLRLLAPAIHEELINSPPPDDLEVLLRAVAVCCQRASFTHGGPQPVPSQLREVLPQAIKEHFLHIYQEVQQGRIEEGGPLKETERRLRPCLALLLSAPILVSAVIQLLSLSGEQRGATQGEFCQQERSVIAAMLSIEHICNCKSLEKELLGIEKQMRTVMAGFKGTVANSGRQRRDALQRAYGSLQGRTSLLYGWRLDEQLGEEPAQAVEEQRPKEPS